MELIDALSYLLTEYPIQGRLAQGKWLNYKISEDGTQILREDEPIRLEELPEIEWRHPPKSPKTWVIEAKALLEMGASMVDANTLKGVLARIEELEKQLKLIED